MKDTCPECGGRRIHVARVVARRQMIDLLPKVGGLFDRPTFKSYICADCGHYRLFVPEEHLEDVKKNLPKLRPT